METRREIVEVIPYNQYGASSERYYAVEFRVWDLNGKHLGSWTHWVYNTPDAAGAALKTLNHWSKLDARNERRRKKKKEHNDG